MARKGSHKKAHESIKTERDSGKKGKKKKKDVPKEDADVKERKVETVEKKPDRPSLPPAGLSTEGLRVGVGITLLGLLLTLFVSLSAAGPSQGRYVAANEFSTSAATVSKGDLVYLKDGNPTNDDLAVCVLDIFTYPAICQIVEATEGGYRVRYREGEILNTTSLKQHRVKGAIDPVRTVNSATVENYANIAALGLLLTIGGVGAVIIKGLEREE